MGLLKKLKFSLGKNTISKMYTVLIRPRLDYAPVVWDGCSQNEVEELEIIQECAARIVTGIYQ